MQRGFTLLEVLLASLLLGFGLTAILVSMSQSQKMMLASTYLETAQEVMDFGEMAYPLADVQDPEKDLDQSEQSAVELWNLFSEEAKLTIEQEEKFKGYTWQREWINKHDDKEIERLGGLYIVKVTVKWGDWRQGKGESESYVTFWRKKDK